MEAEISQRADTYSQARQALRRPDYFATQKWMDQKLRADRVGASLEILEFERAFVRRLQRVGIPFFAHCVMRSEQEQLERFRAGRSKAPPGKSPHQHGYAVDLIHSVYGWELPRGPDEPDVSRAWQLVGALGKEAAKAAEVDVTWGGDWGWDAAHWEITGWRKLV
ncbi:M15 family metallopeptidase [Martelella sp. FLE1502]